MKNFAKLKSAYAGTNVLNEDPIIALIDDFISLTECIHIIKLSTTKLQRAKVSLDDSSEIIPGRSGNNCWLRYSEDAIVRAIGERIASFVNLPLKYAEALQIVNYTPGQEYRAHYDAYDLGTPRGMRCCKYGGQRLLTALVYLNDVNEGGGTAFPKCNLTVEPKAGRLVLFHNTTDDINRPHPKSLHAGTPVTDGEKWAFNIWFHARPITEIQDFEKSPDRQDNASYPPHLGDTAKTPALPRQTHSITLRVNRAVRLFETAARKLEPHLPEQPTPVWFTYWDTYGRNFMDRSGIPAHARVIELIPRAISNPLANKATLARMLKDCNLTNLAPPTYESLEEAYKRHGSDVPVWFLKPIFGTGGKSMRCVAHRDLPTETLEENFVVQAAVPDLVLQNGRKFTTRIYALIWNGAVYLYKNGFIIVHGQQYNPKSTDYAVQIDHRGYTDRKSPIKMSPLVEYDEYSSAFPRLRQLVEALSPIFTSAVVASGRDHYLVLGIDVLLQQNGTPKLVEINTSPNFIHTEQINSEVNVPFLESIIRTSLGIHDDRVEKITNLQE